jgi:hypothetical protein
MEKDNYGWRDIHKLADTPWLDAMLLGLPHYRDSILIFWDIWNILVRDIIDTAKINTNESWIITIRVVWDQFYVQMRKNPDNTGRDSQVIIINSTDITWYNKILAERMTTRVAEIQG